MKNLFIISTVASLLLTFSSCQKDVTTAPGDIASLSAEKIILPSFYSPEAHEMQDIKSIFKNVDKQHGTSYSQSISSRKQTDWPDLEIWPGIFDMWTGHCLKSCRKCPCMIVVIGKEPGIGLPPGQGGSSPGQGKSDVIVVANPSQVHKKSRVELENDQQTFYKLKIVSI